MGELPVHDLNAIEQDLGQNFFQVIYAQKDGWVNHYAPEQLRKGEFRKFLQNFLLLSLIFFCLFYRILGMPLVDQF